MSDKKRDSMFAKLAQQQARAELAEAAPAAAVPVEDATPSPGQVPPAPPPTPAARPAREKKKPERVRGRRNNPDYCQFNTYVPKSLRREVERSLLDFDGLDSSDLVEGLLREWLKKPRIPS